MASAEAAGGGAGGTASLRIAVAWSERAGKASEVTVDLPAGATAGDAVRATAHLRPGPSGTASLGIWGRACGGDRMLVAGDRVEIYRPLAMSAGEARRRRAGGRGR